jgi:flavodoxin
MKIEIRYYSKGGNTKKIAEAIGEELGIKAMPISERIKEDIDVLFLCNSVYAASIASPVKDFLRINDRKITTIYNVSTAGIVSSTYKGIKKLCSKYNLNLSEKEFHCKGSWNGKKPNSHPDEKDLEAAKAFAKEVIGK